MRLAFPALALAAALLAPAIPGGTLGADESAAREARLERIVRQLDRGRWEAARKAASRLAQDAARDTWEAGRAASLLAETALCRAIAEIHLGLEHEAVWHWQTAVTLWPVIAERPLDRWGRAVELSEHSLRRPGEMPRGMSPVGDLDLLRLEPAELRYEDAPVIDNPTAARRGPHGDVAIELVVDRDGGLSYPRLLTDHSHPVLVYSMLEWLLALPPATPARLDGEPVDSLTTVTIDFDTAWSTGGLLIDPGDGCGRSGPPGATLG